MPNAPQQALHYRMALLKHRQAKLCSRPLGDTHMLLNAMRFRDLFVCSYRLAVPSTPPSGTLVKQILLV